MKNRVEGRWHLLKTTAIASTFLALSLSTGVQAQQIAGLPYGYGIAADTVMSVTLTGDLHDTYDAIDVALGAWSAPISLIGKRVYRVKVVQKKPPVSILGSGPFSRSSWRTPTARK